MAVLALPIKYALASAAWFWEQATSKIWSCDHLLEFANRAYYYSTKEHNKKQLKRGDKLTSYYTCEEVAQMYKVKTITVWDWIRRKKLGAIKIGRDYRISPEDIQIFESSRKTIRDK